MQLFKDLLIIQPNAQRTVLMTLGKTNSAAAVKRFPESRVRRRSGSVAGSYEYDEWQAE
jgi:hypothetical protein